MWMQKLRENEKLRAHTLRQQHQIQGKSSISMGNRKIKKETENNQQQQHKQIKKEKITSRESSRSSSKENTAVRKRGRPGRRKRKAEKPKIPIFN